ncbi:50S ribosomal protein L11 methyltransferase [Parasphingorhabdus sp. DH2-15]|uniref:50S ribosomal protein L11 methyltransferase n=1 Tax=Parasphingorhabdus sp. DH2-15 TaxID=3444112 RepID=UPI003F684795
MSDSWTLSMPCTKQQGDALASLEMGDIAWSKTPVISALESDPNYPDQWTLVGYFDGKPNKKDIAAFASLTENNIQNVSAEKLAAQDWVTVSQANIEPIKAGRFYIHTPDYRPSDDPQVTSFSIPASLAFGTGHHETTSGCLRFLDAMRASGVRVDNMLDLGTGTGLLAFAANTLWPRAYVMTSDIDPVCEDVVNQNIASNGLKSGWHMGEIGYVTADGLHNDLLQDRAPYDLITANILAGPLSEMAEDISSALVAGGHLILAGLLTSQYQDVARAYRKHGMRVAHRSIAGDWSILWLRKRITK